MRDRRSFLSAVVALSVTAPRIARGQAAERIARIGHLGSGSYASTAHYHEAFRRGLRELGWVQGQNVIIDDRLAEGRFDRLPDLAADLVSSKPDIIVASPTPSAVAAKNATRTIPIVMVSVGDPVRLGLIASLAHPGGNVTGLSYSVGLESFAKSLELLKQVIPDAHREAVLFNESNPAMALAVRDLKAAAQSLDMQVQLVAVRGRNELEDAFATMAKQHVAAVLVVADSLFIGERVRLAGIAAKYRFATMHGDRESVEGGALISYGPSIADQHYRAGTYVDKILKGARPADLPVEQPTKFELVINLKTAKALGVTIPQPLLLRADEIIQ